MEDLLLLQTIMTNVSTKQLFFFQACTFAILTLFLGHPLPLLAEDFHVGPEQEYPAIGTVPWEDLAPGDRVLIHWRTEPYQEKWVIGRSGTSAEPIIVRGIPGPDGQLPVISGKNATTRENLDYWNEKRGLIKIGGASIPSEPIPSFIIIENLEIKSANSQYQFTNDSGAIETYSDNAAAIYVEIGQHLVIRNCIIHDSGNGIFIGNNNWQTQEILIEGNHIHGNGNTGSLYEHNTYTSALNITYQNNFFGGLRSGALGNNLKDRSAGLTIRYNWIENGNRQLDLVDADPGSLPEPSTYLTTFVYGNILKEADGEGNRQMVHYGGDSGNESQYRKGTLFFFNNTLISTRSDRTTMFRLSSNDESAEVFNNIVYTTADGNSLSLADSAGQFIMYNNWLKSGWRLSHGSFTGTLNQSTPSLTGSFPGFVNFTDHDYHLSSSSLLINKGASLPTVIRSSHPLIKEYEYHRSLQTRHVDGVVDIGAFEYSPTFSSGSMLLLLLDD